MRCGGCSDGRFSRDCPKHPRHEGMMRVCARVSARFLIDTCAVQIVSQWISGGDQTTTKDDAGGSTARPAALSVPSQREERSDSETIEKKTGDACTQANTQQGRTGKHDNERHPCRGRCRPSQCCLPFSCVHRQESSVGLMQEPHLRRHGHTQPQQSGSQSLKRVCRRG